MNGHKGIVKTSHFFLKSRTLQLVSWTLLSLLVGISDYFSGPIIQFPFVYIFPIACATWFNGRRWGLAFAFGLPLIRIFFSFIWTISWSFSEVVINALIRIIVFSLIVFLVHSEVRRRTLAQEVKALKGLLPICSFCKKIRIKDGSWIPIEAYIEEHSEAELTHGFCPACMIEHYGIELPPLK